MHNRQILCTDPYIVFPGNSRGRHGKEPREKSCELVTVSDVVFMIPISTSVVPWIHVDIDVSACLTGDDVYENLRTVLGALAAKR